MTFGPERHQGVNHLFNERLAGARPLVMAHRGTAIASIVENTTGAVLAAVRSGADIVEIDVTGSTDGVFFAHHDGLERENFEVAENFRTWDAAAIEAVRHGWSARPDRQVGVERIGALLRGFRHDPGASPASGLAPVLFNIDRSWWWWPAVLDDLAALDMTSQLLLKCHAANTDALEVLGAHPEPFPFMAICTTPAEIDQVCARNDLNLIGIEVIAPTADHPFARPGAVKAIHDRGLFALVNAEVLPIPVQCFPGLPDETAVMQGPQVAYEPLIQLGFDVIQTDWPWLVSAYRATRPAIGN